MMHVSEHIQVQLMGQTVAPNVTMTNKEVLKRQERQRKRWGFGLFVRFVFSRFLRDFILGLCCRGQGWIWRHRKISRIRMPNMKLPKNQ